MKSQTNSYSKELNFMNIIPIGKYLGPTSNILNIISMCMNLQTISIPICRDAGFTKQFLFAGKKIILWCLFAYFLV